MAATTQPVPGLHVSAPDDMDLHTDDGFDFGDGDIELGLDPASAHDEDLSLHDAASESGLDLENASVNQDDYMADHGDLIEEDIYDDDAGSVVMQALTDDPVTHETTMTTPETDMTAHETDMTAHETDMTAHETDMTAHETDMIAPETDVTAPEAYMDEVTDQELLDLADNDLIDYSDDEGQQLYVSESNTFAQEDIDAHDKEHEDLSYLSNASLEDTQGAGHTEAGEEANEDDAKQSHDSLATTADPADENETSPSQHESPSFDEQHTGEDDGVELHPEETALSEGDDVQSAQNAGSEYRQIVQFSELQRISVSYGEGEYWLFKQHDLEESGDWMLDDTTLAKSSMSDLFKACRLWLGDEVSDEHELYFCFVNFNDMQLSEDNTACVAITLERLVDVYYLLQAQDNNAEPEPFCVTLQTRPRFATLMSDIVKFADEERGYFSLTYAISIGQTRFTMPVALQDENAGHHSSEYDNDDWDDQKFSQHHDTPEDQKPEEHINYVPESELNIEAQNNDEDPGKPQNTNVFTSAEHVDVDDSTSELHRLTDDGETDNAQLEESPKKVQETAEHSLEHKSEEQGHATEQVAEEDDWDLDDENTILAQPAETDTDQGAVESTEQYGTTDDPETHTSPIDARTPEQILHDKQVQDDIVDYSDDEVDEADTTAFDTKSPSSTTIQGDEPVSVHDQNEDTGDTHDETGQTFVDDGIEGLDFDADYKDSATTDYDQHTGFDDDTTFHVEVQQLEQDDSLAGFDADATEGDSFEQSFQGEPTHDANEYQNADHEINVDNNGGYDTHVADSVAAGDYLDLYNAPEWVTDKEPAFDLPDDVVLAHDDDAVSYDQKKDTGELSAVSGPPAADSATASSTESRKRSVDEAGHGTDDATKSTEAKRLRV